MRDVLLVNNLKPHCVSLISLTTNNQTRKWKPYIRTVRKKDRVATDSSSKCARDPQETARASLSLVSAGKKKMLNINSKKYVFSTMFINNKEFVTSYFY